MKKLAILLCAMAVFAVMFICSYAEARHPLRPWLDEGSSPSPCAGGQCSSCANGQCALPAVAPLALLALPQIPPVPVVKVVEKVKVVAIAPVKVVVPVVVAPPVSAPKACAPAGTVGRKHLFPRFRQAAANAKERRKYRRGR